ncbi:uncharacterized protein PFLUO_LOCUS872 [Penicillium psychrofluorescens]|uniref:uncharacterized protein n=1 Tax=Penicillium psychrofluorescens TaxID=3158075 RepID=UPI003CCCD37F
MAPSRSFLFCFLSLVWSPLVLAAPWIVTDDFEKVVITNHPYYWMSTDAEVITSIESISPTATVMPDVLSTITSTGSGYYASDITVVEELYPTGAGVPVDGIQRTADSFYHTTVYYVNLVYSAPTGCSTQFTTTTSAVVTPPALVGSALPRTSVSTSTSVDNAQPFQPTTWTIDEVWVAPTQVPTRTLASLSAEYAPTSLYYGSGCQYISPDDSPYYYSGYDGGYDEEDWFFDTWPMGVSWFAIVMICVLGWVGLILIIGFIEAWVRFRRMMTGWQTRRGLPVMWAFLIFPITLLLLIFRRRGFRARTQSESAELKGKWDAMSGWTKLRLFFVWGFRYKYPPMLGGPPARVSKKAVKTSGPPLLQETRAASRTGSADGPSESTHPEMGEVPHAQSARPETSGARPDEKIGRAQ